MLFSRRSLTTNSVNLANMALDGLSAGIGIFENASGQPDLIGFVQGASANKLDIDRDFIALV